MVSPSLVKKTSVFIVKVSRANISAHYSKFSWMQVQKPLVCIAKYSRRPRVSAQWGELRWPASGRVRKPGGGPGGSPGGRPGGGPKGGPGGGLGEGPAGTVRRYI